MHLSVLVVIYLLQQANVFVKLNPDIKYVDLKMENMPPQEKHSVAPDSLSSLSPFTK